MDRYEALNWAEVVRSAADQERVVKLLAAFNDAANTVAASTADLLCVCASVVGQIIAESKMPEEMRGGHAAMVDYLASTHAPEVVH